MGYREEQGMAESGGLQGPQRIGRAGTAETMASGSGPCKEGDNEGVRVNLEARTRLPKRPAGLIKYLRQSGTHKVESFVFKEKKKSTEN